MHKDSVITKRNKLLKLELSGDVVQQLNAVGNRLYDTPVRSITLATDSSLWTTIDDTLYTDAKVSYDKIVNAYIDDPKVYKFESTKHIIWKENEMANRPFEESENDKESTSYISKQTKRIIKPVVGEIEVDKTFLDPFSVSKNWQRTAETEYVEYINEKTGETICEEPPQIWAEKLQALDRLSPREDLDGYEYRESIDEQMFRISKQLEYQDRLQMEIERRQHYPTEIEQVEDVLYDIVSAISSQEEEIQKMHKALALDRIRNAWNPATRGYKMKRLGANITEDGEMVPIISDLDFCNMIISSCGYLLATTSPPGLFEKHEMERMLFETLEQRKKELEALESQRPLIDKVRLALKDLKEDPNEFTRKVVNDLFRHINDWINQLPKEISTKWQNYWTRNSIALMRERFSEVLDIISSFDYEDGVNLYHDIMNYKSSPIKVKPKNLSNSIQRLVGPNEDIIKAAHHSDQHPRPVKPPDCVLITLTILVDVPPAYTIHPPKTKSDNRKEFIYKTLDRMNETAKNMKDIVVKELPKWPEKKVQFEADVSNSSSSAAHYSPKLIESMEINSLEAEMIERKFIDPMPIVMEPKEDDPSLYDEMENPTPLDGERSMSAALSSLTSSSDAVMDDDDDGEDDSEDEDTADDYTLGNGKLQSKTALNLKSMLQKITQPVQSSMMQMVDKLGFQKSKPMREEMMPHIPAEKCTVIQGTLVRKIEARKICASAKFDGFIKPEDLVMRNILNLDPLDTLVYDDKDRKEFEATLVKELAEAMAIPTKNICIEEIRRLEVDSTDLRDKKKKREDNLIELSKQKEAELLRVERNRIYRKAWVDGSLAKFYMKELEERLRLKELNEKEVDERYASNNFDRRSTMYAISGDLLSTSIQSIEESDETSENQLNEESVALSAESMNEATDTENGSQSVDYQPLPTSIPTLRRDLSLPAIVHQHNAEELKSQQVVNKSPLRISKPSSTRPEYLKHGILNPSDLKLDPSYWLAQDLLELNEAERRLIRISRLKLLTRQHAALKRIEQIQRVKEELIEDTLDSIQPLIEYMEPLLEKATPILKEANQRFMFRTSKLLNSLETVLKSSLNNAKVQSMLQMYQQMIARLSIVSDEDRNNQMRSRKLLSTHFILPLNDRSIQYNNEVLSDEEIVEQLMYDMCRSVEHRAALNLKSQQQSFFPVQMESNDPDFLKEIIDLRAENDSEVHQQPLNDEDEDKDQDDVGAQAFRELSEKVVEERNKAMSELVKEETMTCASLHEIAEELESLNGQERRLSKVNISKLSGEEDGREFSYPQEIIELMEDMCVAVENEAMYANDSSVEETISDLVDVSPTKKQDWIEKVKEMLRFRSADVKIGPLARQSTWIKRAEIEEEEIKDEYFENRLVGCEVSIMVTITDEQRNQTGLSELNAEDVAVMLQLYLNDLKRPLATGKITKDIIDVSYKIPFRQQQFTNWPSFWVNLVHPSFFGYSTANRKKDTRYLKADSNLLPSSLQQKKISKPSPLPSGILVQDPSESFTKRNRETIESLNKRMNYNLANGLLPLSYLSSMDSAESALIGLHPTDYHLASTELEPFGSNTRRVQIFRPNMAELTEHDIDRLKKTYKALQEQYQKAMKKGLVDGVRLDPEQCIALKEKETAYRIYISARQKYGREHHKHLSSVVPLPTLKITKINEDDFNHWVEDAHQQGQLRLKELREKKQKLKEILKREAETRRNFGIKKDWIISTFMDLHQKYRNDLKIKFYQELKKQDEERVNNKRSAESLETEKELKKSIISEGKRNRKLFIFVNRWLVRCRSSSLPLNLKDYMSMTNDSFEPVILQSTSRGGTGRKEEIIYFNQDVSSPNRALRSSLKSRDGNEIQRNVTFDAVLQETIDDDKKTTEGPTVIISQSMDDNDKAINSSDEIRIRTPTSERPNSRSSMVSSEPVTDEGNIDLVLSKTDVLHFLDLAVEEISRERTPTTKENSSKMKRKKISSPTSMTTWFTAPRKGLIDAEGVISEVRERNRPFLVKSADFNDVENSQLVMVPSLRRSLSQAIESKDPSDPLAIMQSDDDHVRIDAKLLPEEIDLVRSLKWVDTLLQYPEFVTCLDRFPTTTTASISRDELVQFAAVLAEIEPIISKLLRELDAKQALKTTPSMKLKDKEELLAKEKEIKTQQEKEEEEEKLRLERENRLLELRKQAERERIWFMAHTHKFIQYPGTLPFCIVCKQRRHDYWIKEQHDNEKAHKKSFEERLNEREKVEEEELQEQLVKSRWDGLMVQAKEEVIREMKDEEQSKSRSNSSKALLLRRLSDVHEMRRHPAVPMDETKRIGFDDDMESNPGNSLLDDLSDEEKQWQNYLKHVKELLKRLGLSVIDARGRSMLPTLPHLCPTFKLKEKDFVPPQVLQNELSFFPMTGTFDDNMKSVAIIVRMWHRDELGRKARFLGSAEISHEVLSNPPLGNRSYKLFPDVRVIDQNPLIEITGTISIRIKMMKKGKKRRGDRSNQCWMFEIVKAHRLGTSLAISEGSQQVNEMKSNAKKEAEALELTNDSSLSHGVNPFGEIVWKGLAEFGDEMILLNDFVSVGQTKKKVNSINPTFDGETDQAVFELPPIWTEDNISGRGVMEDEVVKGGGWVARNQVPVRDESQSKGGGGGLKKMQKMEDKVMDDEIFQSKINQRAQDLLHETLKGRVEEWRWSQYVEERERHYLYREECDTRNVLMDSELSRCQPLIDEQNEYSRQFSRQLQLIQSPSNILARLRFMMGESLEGGGMKAMCEDPSYGRMLDVVVIPILYPRDEERISVQLTTLIGKHGGNLAKIFDFAIHQLRDYNHNGFVSLDERCALVVMEHYLGCNMSEYMQQKWDAITNQMFRDLLRQIANGLMNLHDDKILHRNIHPNCVIVEEVDMKASKKSMREVSTVKCFVTDYWFLHNPRAPGCRSSLGRADWGNRMTAPPETMGGDANSVTDKSDVFGFGVCVYYWATKGMMIPLQNGITFRVESIRSNIPIKWNSWVFSLLSMCLSPNPQLRAEMKEIHSFLSKAVN